LRGRGPSSITGAFLIGRIVGAAKAHHAEMARAQRYLKDVD